MKFFATFALLMTASSAVRIQNAQEAQAAELIAIQQQMKEEAQEQANAEALTQLETEIDNMEQELWNLRGAWKKARQAAHNNPKVAAAIEAAKHNAAVQ